MKYILSTTERDDFDSLSADGQRYYTQVRSRRNKPASHDAAYTIALIQHGSKSPQADDLLASIAAVNAGIDPRITW